MANDDTAPSVYFVITVMPSQSTRPVKAINFDSHTIDSIAEPCILRILGSSHRTTGFGFFMMRLDLVEL
jgi:hypothetical protein